MEPVVTLPGLLLAALSELLIDIGRSVSEGRARAPRELLALVRLSLLTALVVAGYGPYWMVAVLLVTSGPLATMAVAVEFWRGLTLAEPSFGANRDFGPRVTGAKRAVGGRRLARRIKVGALLTHRE